MITANDCNTRPRHLNRTAPKARPRETIWLHWLMKQMFYLRAITTIYLKDQKVSTRVWKNKNKNKETLQIIFIHHLLIRFPTLKSISLAKGGEGTRRSFWWCCERQNNEYPRNIHLPTTQTCGWVALCDKRDSVVVIQPRTMRWVDEPE